MPATAELTELVAGYRQFKSNSRPPTEGRIVATLVLNVDPTKGPFTCDFALGEYRLKLLSVKVQSRVGDTRMSCRVSHPDSDKTQDVYFRVFGNEKRHKFLELPSKSENPNESFFVTIDKVLLDIHSGLWKKIELSLYQVKFPPIQIRPNEKPNEENKQVINNNRSSDNRENNDNNNNNNTFNRDRGGNNQRNNQRFNNRSNNNNRGNGGGGRFRNQRYRKRDEVESTPNQ